jgi:Cu-Zn family superoxide dismutase
MVKVAPLWNVATVVTLALCASCEQDRNEVPRTTAEQGVPRTPDPMTGQTATKPTTSLTDEKQLKAEAELKAAEGQDNEGDIEFHSTDTGVHIVATVEDASPGKHGIHIHETVDCSDIQGKSMGDHFAPEKHEHALPVHG